MSTMDKVSPIQFRTDQETREQIEIMAASHRISVSAYLRMIARRDYAAYRAVKLVPAVGMAEEDEQSQKIVLLD